jgi:hypothetical protein
MDAPYRNDDGSIRFPYIQRGSMPSSFRSLSFRYCENATADIHLFDALSDLLPYRTEGSQTS